MAALRLLAALSMALWHCVAVVAVTAGDIAQCTRDSEGMCKSTQLLEAAFSSNETVDQDVDEYGKMMTSLLQRKRSGTPHSNLQDRINGLRSRRGMLLSELRELETKIGGQNESFIGEPVTLLMWSTLTDISCHQTSGVSRERVLATLSCLLVICGVVQVVGGLGPIGYSMISMVCFGITLFLQGYAAELFAQPYVYVCAINSFQGVTAVLVHAYLKGISRDQKYEELTGKARSLEWSALSIIFIIPGIFFVCANYSANAAFEVDPCNSGVNSAILCMDPIPEFIFFWWYSHEQPSLQQFLGSMLAVSGGVLGGVTSGNGANALAIAWCGFGLLSLSVNVICVKLSSTVDLGVLVPWVYQVMVQGAGGFLLFPLHAMLSGHFEPVPLSLWIWPLLGCFAQGLGHYAMILSFTSPGAITGVNGAVIGSCSLVNFFLDWYLLGYSPAFIKKISMVAIVIGVISISVAEKPKDSAAEPTPKGASSVHDTSHLRSDSNGRLDNTAASGSDEGTASNSQCIAPIGSSIQPVVSKSVSHPLNAMSLRALPWAHTANSEETWDIKGTIAYWAAIFQIVGTMIFIVSWMAMVFHRGAGDIHVLRALCDYPFMIASWCYTLSAYLIFFQVSNKMHGHGALENDDADDIEREMSFFALSMESWGHVGSFTSLFGSVAFVIAGMTMFGCDLDSSFNYNVLYVFPCVMGAICLVFAAFCKGSYNKWRHSGKFSAQDMPVTQAYLIMVGASSFAVARTFSFNHFADTHAGWKPYVSTIPSGVGCALIMGSSWLDLHMWKAQMYGMGFANELRLDNMQVQSTSSKTPKKHVDWKQQTMMLVYCSNVVIALFNLSMHLAIPALYEHLHIAIFGIIRELGIYMTILGLASVIHKTPDVHPYDYLLWMMRLTAVWDLIVQLDYIKMVVQAGFHEP